MKPEELLRAHPFLNMFTRRLNHLSVIMNAQGIVTYCHYRYSHDQPHMASEIMGKNIFKYYQLPRNKSLEKIVSDLKGPCRRLSQLNWELMNQYAISDLFAVFFSTPFCDQFVSYPNFHVKYPQSRIHITQIDGENFLGVISFAEFQSPVSMFSSEVVVITDLNNRIVAYNQALLDLHNADDKFFDRPLSSLFAFEKEGAPGRLADAQLHSVALDPSILSPVPRNLFSLESGTLSWKTPLSDQMRFLHVNIPLNHDRCDYQLSFKATLDQGTFPCLITRAETINPPDNFGFLFGPHPAGPALILKQSGITVQETRFPDINNMTEAQFSLEKRNNRMIYSVNGIPAITYLEEYQLPAVPGDHLAFLVRPGTACAVNNMRLFLSRPGETAIPPVFAVLKNRLGYKYRVHREPFEFGVRAFYAYRLENVTSFEKKISQLKRERDLFHDSLRGREAMAAYVGQNARVVQIKDTLQTLSQSARSVLFTGETGTGKEVLANLFHALSGKARAPYVKVDCSTLPPTLLESELFGYEPGAFTGAASRHLGKFEQAQHGTLYLDEVSNISMETQAKLLGVLEDFRITRLGGNEPVQLDLAVVASSNRPLEALIKQNAFRPDLFYRLSRFRIDVPPLRERMDDIPHLARHFLDQANREYRKKVKGITEAGYKKLYSHTWPGNIRELKNVIFKAVLFTEARMIGPKDLDIIELGRGPAAVPGRALRYQGARDMTRQGLEAALKQCRGNVFAVVEKLGVARGTVYNKMRKFGLDPDAFRA
jgi:DNA-binding NtrC family response regulator